jgi:hypothetical protein
MPGDWSPSGGGVPIAWVTYVEGEPPRSSKRHIWDQVPWEVARDWPPKRLRTLCGMVVPRAAVPGAPADASDQGVQAHSAAETTALGLCERCERAVALRHTDAGQT